ncbi:MAG: ribosome silencing factor [Campylobacterales bacterium]
MTLQERIQRIIKLLDEKKAENIESFNLSDSGYFVDAVVIATTLASKHALALTDHLRVGLKESGETIYHTDDADEWTILDLGDIIVHLMSEEHRKKYNLEEFLTSFAQKRQQR